MNIIEMLEQSVVLTVLGMGVVFSFLIILVIVISQIGRFVSAKDSDKSLEVQTASFTPASGIKQDKTVENNPQITAVISAAINEYRESN